MSTEWDLIVNSTNWGERCDKLAKDANLLATTSTGGDADLKRWLDMLVELVLCRGLNNFTKSNFDSEPISDNIYSKTFHQTFTRAGSSSISAALKMCNEREVTFTLDSKLHNRFKADDLPNKRNRIVYTYAINWDNVSPELLDLYYKLPEYPVNIRIRRSIENGREIVDAKMFILKCKVDLSQNNWSKFFSKKSTIKCSVEETFPAGGLSKGMADTLMKSSLVWLHQIKDTEYDYSEDGGRVSKDEMVRQNRSMIRFEFDENEMGRDDSEFRESTLKELVRTHLATYVGITDDEMNEM